MSGDHTEYHGTAEVLKGDETYLTRDETNELINALEEAVYLLDPTDEDLEKRSGVYRVVRALEKLKEKNT